MKGSTYYVLCKYFYPENGKQEDVSVILCLHLGHANLGIFIDTELVVIIHIKIIARIRLTKVKVEHFEEALCVLV